MWIRNFCVHNIIGKISQATLMKTIDNDDIQSDDNDDDESATSHRNVGPARVFNISLIMYNEHIKLHYPDRPFTIAHRQEH